MKDCCIQYALFMSQSKPCAWPWPCLAFGNNVDNGYYFMWIIFLFINAAQHLLDQTPMHTCVTSTIISYVFGIKEIFRNQNFNKIYNETHTKCSFCHRLTEFYWETGHMMDRLTVFMLTRICCFCLFLWWWEMGYCVRMCQILITLAFWLALGSCSAF